MNLNIEINSLKKKFKGKDEKTIFDNVNLELDFSDEIVTLWGPSGSGKSTLLNMILGYDQKYEGTIKVLSQDVKKMKKKEYIKYLREDIAIVNQDNKLLENLTVKENLFFLVKNEKKIIEKLEFFNLEILMNKKICDLSGGQKQKTAIIRALIKEPKILILDEPSSSMDDLSFAELIKILDLIKKNTQIIVVTHDQRFNEFSREQYKIEGEKIVRTYSPEVRNSIVWNQDEKEISYNFGIKKGLMLIKNNILNYFVKLLLTFVIMLLFSFVFVNANYESEKYLSGYYGGLSEHVVLMDFENIKENYKFNDNSYQTPDDKLYWSAEDAEKIEKIPGVSKTYFFTDEVTNTLDDDGNFLDVTLNSKTYPSVMANKPSASSGKNIEINFSTLQVPNEVLDYYIPENLIGIDMLEGTFPTNESDEIAIPDFIADQIIENNRYERYEDMIGSSLKLEVKNSKGEQIEKNYSIAGIYKTNYASYLDDSYTIFLSFRNSITLSGKEVYGLSENTDKYYDNIYREEEKFISAYGTGQSDIAIILDENTTGGDVYKELEELYPNNIQQSRYTYQLDEEFTNQSKYMVKMYLTVIGMFIIIVAIILFLVNRGYYYLKNRELSILLSLGYSKKELTKLLIFEIIIDAVAVAIGIGIMAVLCGFIHLKSFQTFASDYFEIINIAIVIAISISINILNVIYVFTQIKYKALLNKMK